MPLGDDASEGPWGSLAILPSWGGGDPDSNSGGPIYLPLKNFKDLCAKMSYVSMQT